MSENIGFDNENDNLYNDKNSIQKKQIGKQI